MRSTKLVVGNGIAVAEHMAATWVSKIGCGTMPAWCQTIFDILTGGVENLQHLLVGHQLEERLEVDARSQRIDHDRFLRARHLHDAEQRIIGRLAQKFGIDGDDRVFREAGANGGKFQSGGDKFHERSMTLLKRAFCRKR